MAKDFSKPGYAASADPSADAWAAPLMKVERFRHAAGFVDVIRLLLLCRTETERRVVGLCEWQGRPVDEAAAAVGVAPGRVADVLGSVRARATAAVARQERERRLAETAGELKGRRAVPGFKKRPPGRGGERTVENG